MRMKGHESKSASKDEEVFVILFWFRNKIRKASLGGISEPWAAVLAKINLYVRITSFQDGMVIERERERERKKDWNWIDWFSMLKKNMFEN